MVFSSNLGTNRICIFCKQILTNSDAGVGSHLEKHIKSGELKRKDKLKTKLRILGRPFKKYKRQP